MTMRMVAPEQARRLIEQPPVEIAPVRGHQVAEAIGELHQPFFEPLHVRDKVVEAGPSALNAPRRGLSHHAAWKRASAPDDAPALGERRQATAIRWR